ncbi:MAG: GspE/PulE family protein [Candidatus Moranbacteria bacterium]|nr:GspE/PulE family protein [Candidatus Moranbacteria bacterium]
MKGLSDSQISEILLKGEYVTQEDISSAKEYSKKHRSSIVDYFLSEGILDKDILGQAIAEYFNMKYADLNTHPPSASQVLRVSEETAKKYRLVLFNEGEKEVVFTTDNPAQVGLKEELEKIFKGRNIVLAYSISEDIDNAFMHYQKDFNIRFKEIIENEDDFAPIALNEIIDSAILNHASDIHFGTQRDEVIIRFRIDGVLREMGVVPKSYYQNILNKIKIDSELKIDEHFVAQDGSMQLEREGKIISMRISIVPSRHGEKVVIRILSKYVTSLSLGDLGILPGDQEVITEASKNPFGMILVVGPTGSGKTTTLYAVLKLINHPEINITTIEDPIEYEIPGATQIQVNNQAGLTFSKGLRSIVRQDPDVILVGEIRDKDTAEISVNAALTGHLLFSTFHSNNASTTIPRLMDIGLEPFLLSSTLDLIIAQRLVRKICDNCRKSYSAKKEEIERILPNADEYFSDDEVTLYKGEGCSVCANTGYKGRSIIVEIIDVTQEIKEMILKNPSSGEIWEVAKRQGSHSLFEDGIEKVKNGLTTMEELIRVAPRSH